MERIQNRKITVCYVRHGQTFDNANHILAGHTPGKLTEIGIQQAQRTGEHLKDAHFDYVYVSDLGRTRETYEGIVSRATHLAGITPQFLELIRERSVGVMVGQAAHLMETNPAQQGIDVRQYKCAEAQSWVDVYHRAYKFLHLLIQKHIKQAYKQADSIQKNQEDVRILVVTHGGYIMETHNAVQWITAGREPTFINNAKNCCFHQFQFKYTGNFEQPIDDKFIKAEVLKNNNPKY